MVPVRSMTVRRRSFTVAAARENATQSGVSQHIRKLEEGFRVKLFNREKGQVAPTPAADAYYNRCIQILRNIESGNDAMRAFTGISGEIFVGLLPTMTRATLSPGRGVAFPIRITTAARYHLDLLGLGRDFTARLEDDEGAIYDLRAAVTSKRWIWAPSNKWRWSSGPHTIRVARTDFSA